MGHCGGDIGRTLRCERTALDGRRYVYECWLIRAYGDLLAARADNTGCRRDIRDSAVGAEQCRAE